MDQNIIKLRSNRAYLCKWAKHTDILAHEQIVKQGVTAGSDLLEAAGCLLRLAMWPTQHLWDVVDKLIAEELYKLGSSVDPDNAISMEEYSTMHKVFILRFVSSWNVDIIIIAPLNPAILINRISIFVVVINFPSMIVAPVISLGLCILPYCV